MNTTQWIKTSDRAPTEQDLPVWVYDSKVPNGASLKGPMLLMCCPSAEAWSHWRPAKDDIPEPPVEETQDDKDMRFAESWVASKSGNWITRDLARAIFAYERAEVAKMLPPPAKRFVWSHGDYDAIEAVRARCGGGGK
jgi:hypothetical protein